jgi:hypothetical protein
MLSSVKWRFGENKARSRREKKSLIAEAIQGFGA